MTNTAARAATLAVLLTSVCSAPFAAAVQATAADTAAGSAAPAALTALAGRWIVDLRAAPAEPRYDKPMTLAIAADRSVTGEFYDSTIDAGRASASNGRVCFAFRTTDGVGPYHTSGCLVGDRIVGQTWAEHRNFVLNWSAKRE